MSEQEGESLSSDQAYFSAVEEIFIALRGAPLLLSPADWQVAREWHRQGVPLAIIRQSLEELFGSRRERGLTGTVNSLRYCASSVERNWQLYQEMTGPPASAATNVIDVKSRLAALAASLPDGPAFVPEIRRALEALSAGAREAEEVLSRLDEEMLRQALTSLDAEQRVVLTQKVESILSGHADRLPEGELSEVRERLERQVLRRLLGLPVLSLFSPQAGPPSA